VSLYVMASRGGRARELIRITDGDASGAAWSRDGGYIAFTSGDRVGVIRRTGRGLTWIADASRPTWLTRRRIAFYESNSDWRTAVGVATADGTGRSVVARASELAAYDLHGLAASPVGTTIIFSTIVARADAGPLYVVNVDRGSPPRRIVPGALDATWAPSGRRLAFRFPDLAELWTVRSDGSQRRRLWRSSTSWPTLPSWSPDGTRIAFLAHRDGASTCNLLVMNLRRRSSRVVARIDSSACFHQPVWSSNGSRLYYVDLPSR
jgi:Tol biopolymer transport system component